METKVVDGRTFMRVQGSAMTLIGELGVQGAVILVGDNLSLTLHPGGVELGWLDKLTLTSAPPSRDEIAAIVELNYSELNEFCERGFAVTVLGSVTPEEQQEAMDGGTN